MIDGEFQSNRTLQFMRLSSFIMELVTFFAQDTLGGGVDKLTACINEWLNNHGWCLVKKFATASPLVKSGIIFLLLTILFQALC
jgi:hypothetical protein